MERNCSTCIYYELDSTSSPCKECLSMTESCALWCINNKSTEDIKELLNMILENQKLIRKDIEQIRIRLEKED